MGSRNSLAWARAVMGVLVLACAYVPRCPQASGQESPAPRAVDPQPIDLLPVGFAYDPEKEEGPHPESDFEWWYHFGFLRRPGAADYEYAFVSSFQRNKIGRYLFYNLSELKTGKSLHHAVVDKSLLGGWPFLPEGHQFMVPADPSAESPKSELWLRYGDNRLHKEDSSYSVSYQNKQFFLDLTLRKDGMPLPVGGTGLTGIEKPEDQHYYSYPRLPAFAHLRKDGQDIRLEGTVWYDHQWGKVATGKLMKWCWWGLRLDNGENLSIFFLQDMKTNATVQKALTLQHANGKTEVFHDVTFEPKRSWKSPRGKTYSVEWDIRLPTIKLAIRIRPLTDEQEIPVLLYGQIWEGPCTVEVTDQAGRDTKGWGFQEMIGQ